MKETAGDAEFKGAYSYETVLASTSVEKTCVYPQDSTTKFVRKCITDFEFGTDWDKLLVKNCKTKYESTEKFLELQVHIVYPFI